MSDWQSRLDYLTSKATGDLIPKIFNSITSTKLEKEEHIVKLIAGTEFYRDNLLEWIDQILATSQSTHCKAASRASTYRALGNEKFRAFDNDGSLAMYTESVRYAPETSTDLPLALANRSAALFHMEEYKECLRDIDIALLKGYPLHLQYKLRTRQSSCHLKMGHFREAVDSLTQARKAMEYIDNVPKSKMTLLQKEIDASMVSAMEQLNLQPSSCNSHIPQVIVPTHCENTKFAYASAALDLKFDKLRGRHVITNRDIKIGDILFVESPFAFVVLPDSCRQHCHQCCATFTTPIPCWQCTDALYCSDECRQASWSQYHQYECQGLPIFHSIGIAHLGLRVVLKGSPLEKLKQSCENMRSSSLNTSDVYGCKDDNYSAVYNLMPHVNEMDREDLFQYALTAVLLLLYLKHNTDYFKKNQTQSDIVGDIGADEAITNDNVFVGGLILRHIAQLVCNGHAITKLETQSSVGDAVSSVVSETQVRVATAIYPSASMMNHSCDPNIVNSFNNNQLIVRATKAIPKHSEVFNCYGPHFRRMSLKERQNILSCQYFFKCSCGPCSLPVDHDFQERFNALLCLACGGPVLRTSVQAEGKTDKMVCIDCGRAQSISCLVESAFKAHELYSNGCRDLELGDTFAALREFQACLQLRKDCLYKSNQELTACIDQIARCYSTIGDFGQSTDYLLQCLPAVTEQFGEHSIEFANELQKLSDVMLADLQYEKPGTTEFKSKHKALKKYVDQAYTIMDLQYGNWNLGLQEIEAKRAHLEEIEKVMK